MKNIIDGEECCFRCGISRKDARKYLFECQVNAKLYRNHMWTAPLNETA